MQFGVAEVIEDPLVWSQATETRMRRRKCGVRGRRRPTTNHEALELFAIEPDSLFECHSGFPCVALAGFVKAIARGKGSCEHAILDERGEDAKP